MVGNEGLEISQETNRRLESRYWITAVGIVLAAEIVTLSIRYRGDYMDIGILIGGGIGVIIGRLILAAVSGEPKSRRLDQFLGVIVIGLPLWLVFLFTSDDNLICFFPAVFIGAASGPYLLKQIRRLVLLKWLRIFIGGIIIVGILISAILNFPIVHVLTTIVLVCGVIGALLWVVRGAIDQNEGQPAYGVAYGLGVGFAIFGIALGIVIGVMIDISINGFGFACC